MGNWGKRSKVKINKENDMSPQTLQTMPNKLAGRQTAGRNTKNAEKKECNRRVIV
jgi:hypothetical protein